MDEKLMQNIFGHSDTREAIQESFYNIMTFGVGGVSIKNINGVLKYSAIPAENIYIKSMEKS
jgi:hypothetical protein